MLFGAPPPPTQITRRAADENVSAQGSTVNTVGKQQSTTNPRQSQAHCLYNTILFYHISRFIKYILCNPDGTVNLIKSN
jgi:hypothetical protein